MSSTITRSFPKSRGSDGAIDFGLIFFSSSSSGDASPFTDEKYRLVIESAKFADRRGFSSVWIPERHFTKDGWLYPNPAVLQAALARETSQIHLRAGSVVMPLHHPMRVAEEWAMVDNLSNGRVGLSFASGWHPNDFVFFPENYARRSEEMYRGIEMVRKLWRGEAVQVQGGDGKLVEVRTYPTPVQRELPIWVTAAGNPKTFAGAGELGAHLLTHMYNQSIEELAEKIAIYREARAKHGFDPATGKVSVMVHTFVGADEETAYKQVEGPFCTYLRSASYLLNAIATSRGQQIDMSTLSEEDIEQYMRFVFERMVSTQRVLFGSPESCLPLVKQLYEAGVDEIACQMDFGVETEVVLASMPHLNRLKELANSPSGGTNGTLPVNEAIHAAVSQASLQGPRRDIVTGPTSPVDVGAGLIPSARLRCREELDLPAFYGRLRTLGIELGTSFRGIEQLWRGDGEALGVVALPEAFVDEANAYQVHPTLLDACLQVLIAALPPALVEGEDALYLPTGLRSFRMHERPGRRVWSHALLTTDVKLGMIEGDVRIVSEDGRVLIEALGLQLYRTGTATTTSVVVEETAHNGHEQVARDWLYELRWEHATLQAQSIGERGRGRWLIFMDRVGIGQRLVDLLAARGEASVRVYAGASYEELEAGERYRIDSGRAEDMRRLVSAEDYAGVVYLWGLDGRPFEWVNAAGLEADERASVGGAIHLVQALALRGGKELPRAWLVTSGAQAVGSGEGERVQAVEQAPLWGLGRTWAMEHAELWGGLVDLDPLAMVPQQAEQLLTAILAGQGEDQLAFRSGQAYVARMVRMEQKTLAGTAMRPVRQDAAYMITGGLWGLGLEMARWLVRRGARHLILLGRTKLPVRTPEDGSRVAQQMASLRVLEALGAEVTYAAVDVADEQAMAAFLREYARQGKPVIRGVIHAASVWQDREGQSLVRPLANTTLGALEAVLRPKVVGSWVLYRLLRGSELDFFVLCSSAASLFGSAAQGNYAAAGAFMDALAHRMRAEGTRALSVDWGAVSEIGFGATSEGLRVHEYWESRGIQRISPAQVLAALELLLGQERAQVGVIKLDWQLLTQYYPQIAEMPLVTGLQSKNGAGTTALTTLSEEGDVVAQMRLTGSREGQLRLLEAYSAQQVASVLRVAEERLDIQQPLTALGLDSLMAIELKNRIERALHVRIPIVTFLQGPSIEQFAVQVLEMMQQTDALKRPHEHENGQNGGTNGMSREEAGILLTQLDQLSDAEVDALLSRMTLKEE